MNHIDYSLSFTKREFQLLRMLVWVGVAALSLLDRLGLLRGEELLRFAGNLHDNLRDDGIEPARGEFVELVEAWGKVREGKVCVSQRKCPATFAAAYGSGPLRLPDVVAAISSADAKARTVTGLMRMPPIPQNIPRSAIKAEFVVMFSSPVEGDRESRNVRGTFVCPADAWQAVVTADWYKASADKSKWFIAQRIPQAAGYTYRKVDPSAYTFPTLSDKAEPITYKVQWLCGRDSSHGSWRDYRFEFCPDSGARMKGCTSRNEAYRSMRARLATDSGPGIWSPHRVVPSTTPEGVDKAGRGWYQIEYWSDCKQKYTPCIGNVGWKQYPNRYDTAEDANAAIKSHGFADTSYRVKWHAN